MADSPDGSSAIDGTVLVTGGTGALGGAVLAELLAAGARVTSTYIVDGQRDETIAELGDRGGLELVRADLSSDDGAAQAVAAVGEPLAACVCLVGGFASSGPFHEAPAEELPRLIELNLMTAARIARAAVPKLIAGEGGALVCVGAKAALQPFAGGAAYSVAKASVLALVRALDADYRQSGLRANAIVPSVIDTPANRAAEPDADYSRWVAPAEIARVVRFLCSAESAPISGTAVPVYGSAG